MKFSKQKSLKLTGIFIIFIGVTMILRSFSGSITGYVISETFGANSFSLIGLIIVIFGFIVFEVSKKKLENLAQEAIDSGKVVTNARELKKIANKMNYSGKNVKEGYQILDKYEKPLTVIPNHKEISPGVSRKILYSLATGESNFRRYNN